MTSIREIIDVLQSLAPEEHTLPGFVDNVGLIVGSTDVTTDRVLCCLDVTDEVVDEAISMEAKLIVSHHPFLFSPFKRITNNTSLGGKILKVVENRIAVYSAHTNLDGMRGGINDYLASLFQLKNLVIMEKTVENEGIGRVGELIEPMSLKKLAQKTGVVLSDSDIRIVAKKDAVIKKVAVICGGGGNIEYIELAKKMGADCLITADLKHHIALYANEAGLPIIEPTHYSMEHAFIKEFVLMLSEAANKTNLKVEFFPSKREKSPYVNFAQ